jgi:hypothetical protein
MEEVHKLHKDTTFGWVKALRDFMEAQAHARRERALLLWGDNRAPGSPLGRPDETYRLIRTAFGPRF